MQERNTPIFGRIITNLQQRYILRRKTLGFVYKDSLSEPVLSPLREKGLTGIPDAWNQLKSEVRKLPASYPDYPEFESLPDSEWFVNIFSLGVVIIGTVQFLSAATGIGMNKPPQDER